MIGVVLQDMVADAMTTEVVEKREPAMLRSTISGDGKGIDLATPITVNRVLRSPNSCELPSSIFPLPQRGFRRRCREIRLPCSRSSLFFKSRFY